MSEPDEEQGMSEQQQVAARLMQRWARLVPFLPLLEGAGSATSYAEARMLRRIAAALPEVLAATPQPSAKGLLPSRVSQSGSEHDPGLAWKSGEGGFGKPPFDVLSDVSESVDGLVLSEGGHVDNDLEVTPEDRERLLGHGHTVQHAAPYVKALDAEVAVGKERTRILAAIGRLRRQVVRSPEAGGDSIDAELGSLLNEVCLIVDDAGSHPKESVT